MIRAPQGASLPRKSVNPQLEQRTALGHHLAQPEGHRETGAMEDPNGALQGISQELRLQQPHREW